MAAHMSTDELRVTALRIASRLCYILTWDIQDSLTECPIVVPSLQTLLVRACVISLTMREREHTHAELYDYANELRYIYNVALVELREAARRIGNFDAWRARVPRVESPGVGHAAGGQAVEEVDTDAITEIFSDDDDL